MNLGKTYHDIRTRRDLPIKAVQGCLHQSTISHFEHSDSDVKLSTLLNILAPTCTDAAEYFQLLEIEECPFNQMMTRIHAGYQRNDCGELEDVLHELTKQGVLTIPQRLMTLICRNYIEDIRGNTDFLFSPEDSELIQDYLLRNGHWFQFEYVVFANLCYSLPDSVNERLANFMNIKYQEFHLDGYMQYLIAAYYNMAVRFTDLNKAAAALRTLDTFKINELPNVDLRIRFHFTFLQAVLNAHLGNNEIANRQLVRDMLNTCKSMDPDLGQRLNRWLHRLNFDMAC